ncbi:DNA-binding CsgD family transcriptional regulator [Streptomyces sp. SLBN-8D4]
MATFRYRIGRWAFRRRRHVGGLWLGVLVPAVAAAALAPAGEEEDLAMPGTESQKAFDLLDAVRTIAAGDTLLSPAATRSRVARFLATPDDAAPHDTEQLAVLTPRERETVALVATGLSDQEIAERMFLSPFTVRAHVQRAMTKLEARDRAQLVVIAYRTGLARATSDGGTDRRS